MKGTYHCRFIGSDGNKMRGCFGVSSAPIYNADETEGMLCFPRNFARSNDGLPKQHLNRTQCHNTPNDSDCLLDSEADIRADDR